eukprot:1337036-Prymnesium_polylepis.1
MANHRAALMALLSMVITISLPWGVVAPLHPVFCGAATPAWSSYRRAPRAGAWVGGVMLRRLSFANAPGAT